MSMCLKRLFLKTNLLFISVFLLSGCQKDVSYTYFMQHPKALQQSIEACQNNTFSYCDDVDRAERDFNALVTERLEDPELFGLKIMQAQQLLVNLQLIYQQVEKSDPATWKAAEQAYRAQEDKVKILYAVVVGTSHSELAS